MQLSLRLMDLEFPLFRGNIQTRYKISGSEIILKKLKFLDMIF